MIVYFIEIQQYAVFGVGSVWGLPKLLQREDEQ